MAYSAADPDVLERELRPLRSIGDSYPKTLLTMDRIGLDSYGGIKNGNVIGWLLGSGSQ